MADDGVSTLDARVARIAAEEDPSAESSAILEALDALARDVRMPPETTVPEAIARLNLCLFTQHGFEGDRVDYGNVRNSLLHVVLERRKGLPILLSVIYIEVARRVGVEVEGVGFPGHFLVAVRDADTRYFVDPFNQGRVLRRSALESRLQGLFRRMPTDDQVEAALRPVGHDYILIRINNNLKGAMLRVEDLDGGVRATRRMLTLQPHLHDERHDLVLMLVHLGRREEARGELAAYLDANAERTDLGELRALLAELG